MPQLPPVAAAAFVGCLLVVIIATVVIVRVRSRRRGVRLAQMVRTTAPVPRPATSRIAQPPPAVPLRGRPYQNAEESGRFVVFAERPQRDPTPGRPARRLAAQLAYAAAPAVALPPSPSPVAPVASAPPSREMPRFVYASHTGLAEVVFDLNAPGELEMRAGPSGRVLRPVAETLATEPPVEEPTAEPPAAELPAVEFPIAEPLVTEAMAEAPVPELPMPESPMAPVTEAPAAELPPVETPVAEAPVLPSAPEPAEAIEEAREPEFASSSRRPSTPPLREPQITVLPPRPPVPALPAMMSREVTLGDAARVLRGALPSVLTMTDGRQLRRAVAVGAATSMVAAAFAIRARRR